MQIGKYLDRNKILVYNIIIIYVLYTCHYKSCGPGMINIIYSIEQFQALNKPETIVVTQHSRKRLAERGIELADVCAAINTGTIIEEYPGDFPFPSCLILGKSKGMNLHICASINEEMLYIITGYIPDSAKWKSDLRTRKEETK